MWRQNEVAINKDITDQELQELAEALYAVEKTNMYITEKDRRDTVNSYVFGVFRNLFELNGFKRWIISRAVNTKIG